MDKESERYREHFELIERTVCHFVKGQERPTHLSLIALYAGGHILLEGVPGVGKTFLLNVMAKMVRGGFVRIQGNPDLRPSDIIGKREQNEAGLWPWVPGPILRPGTVIVLGDEINRMPTKSQAAFLEPMQERQVTHGNETYPLSPVLMFVATRNPLEKQETWELPAAQRDRFMFETEVYYPPKEAELAFARDASYRNMSEKIMSVGEPIVTPEEVLAARAAVESRVTVGPAVENYIYNLVNATRNPRDYGIEKIVYRTHGKDVDELVQKAHDAGSSPRGTADLIQASKFVAWLQNREVVHPSDVQAIATDVLMHRTFFKSSTARRSAVARAFMETVLKTVQAQ